MNRITIGKNQFGNEIQLIHDNFAVVIDGLHEGNIFYYSDLGELIQTDFECVLEDIKSKTNKEILSHVIDISNLEIDNFFINLKDRTIDGEKFDFFESKATICFKKYTFFITTNEILGELEQLKAKDEIDVILEVQNKDIKKPNKDIINKLRAIYKAYTREDIKDFIDIKKLENFYPDELENLKL